MKRLPLLLALGLAATACASAPRQTDAERLALYTAHAGEPVSSIRYSGSINGWNSVSDSALVVWTRPNQAYLLQLYGPCADLSYASAISISNSMGQISAGFDNVTVRGGGTSSIKIPCRIQTIREVDMKGLKQAQQELRQADVVERPAEAGK